MTYRQICLRLSEAGIDSAEWDAELLLEHFCKADRSFILQAPDTDYPSAALAEAVARRAARYPLQYLLGEWQFYRQTYEVSPDCLIPRSDTEILVEEAIRLLPQGAYFADLCTGSGCIAVSILAERPDTRALAVEKFPNTLTLATKNAARNHVSSRFTPLCADVLEPCFLPAQSKFDAILSNPPYIRSRVLSELEPELSAEPVAALDGGEDGLIFYRRIIANTAQHLAPGGFFLFEIGFDQAEALLQIGEAANLSGARVLRDYSDNDRAILFRKA